ncbi:MAG: [FeFe] hydrogenase H-cluster radical SAM maturase HydE [Acutalibacteraceae bacterium]|nr:[FeFe] hydrogenase H-cluster radical SAM maturase HydE [Acutalibacteraceae bacterium]
MRCIKVITQEIIYKLAETKNLPDKQLADLLATDAFDNLLYSYADKARQEYYGKEVYLRGLIEFTNYCKNDCYYCGIRKSNKNAVRYRLTQQDILDCCKEGYSLGFRTFVLQGGEDMYFTDQRICEIVSSIRNKYSDCAITLSLGERSKESYQSFYNAGANRYLLRHETANNIHYSKLHPNNMSHKNRKRCLFNLKEIGFQVGSGFMVGSPFQTVENLVEDIRFLQQLKPDMIGIGPYINHTETPFKNYKNGDLKLTLRMISILRLMFPYALIPSTTALGTIHPQGREMGLKAGANVVMPNLSPVRVRKLYDLYENKICTGEEAAQCRGCLEQRIISAGYKAVTAVGDVALTPKNFSDF